jgi:hypothetical protein
MKGKQYMGVLLAAALLGACLGAGATGIRLVVNDTDKPQKQTQLTSTTTAASTIKSSTAIAQTTVSTQSNTTLTALTGGPFGPAGTGATPTFKQPNTTRPPNPETTSP